MKYIKLLILCIMLLPMLASAFTYEEPLQNPQLEIRAQNLFKNIRCLSCISQSISESDSELAKNLRALVRKKIANGETDDEISSFLSERYGERVLLAPGFNKSTYLLWFGPLVFIIIGIVMLLLITTRQKRKGEK